MKNVSLITVTGVVLCLGISCASADQMDQNEIGEVHEALEFSRGVVDEQRFDAEVGQFQAAGEAIRADDDDGLDAVVGDLQQAVEARGQDFPGKKCIRDEKDKSSTSGKCETVCKDKTVYSPHPSEDPPGTFGTCKAANAA